MCLSLAFPSSYPSKPLALRPLPPTRPPLCFRYSSWDVAFAGLGLG